MREERACEEPADAGFGEVAEFSLKARNKITHDSSPISGLMDSKANPDM